MNKEDANIIANMIVSAALTVIGIWIVIVGMRLSEIQSQLNRIEVPIVAAPCSERPPNIDPGFYRPFKTVHGGVLDLLTVPNSTTTSTIPPDYSKP